VPPGARSLPVPAAVNRARKGSGRADTPLLLATGAPPRRLPVPGTNAS